MSARTGARAMSFVRDIDNLKYVIDALKRSSGKTSFRQCVEFSNVDDSVHFIMFVDVAGSGSTFVDVEYAEGLKNSRALGVLARVDDPDDEDFLTAASVRIPPAPSPAQLRNRLMYLKRALNALYHTTICSCNARFKIKGEDVCLLCVLTCADTYADMPREFCCVCQESSRILAMKKMPCCGNHVHKTCFRKLETGAGCPYCRAGTEIIMLT